MTIQEFSVLFRLELNQVYAEGEVDAMWKWFLVDRLPVQANPSYRQAFTVIEGELVAKMKADLKRLKSGEPYQYVMGQAFFFGMQLSVDSRVLIPRPETEEMLELIVEQEGFGPSSIVDVCTGSGCIALGLKKSYPSAHVVALDVEPGVISLASRNAGNLGLSVEWELRDVLKGDWFLGLPRETHLVVSNPPYVLPSEAHTMHTSVLDYEPSIALFVPQEDPLLFYKPIAEYGIGTLVPGGQLWFEINPMNSGLMVDLLGSMGFATVTLLNDLSGKARFVKAIR